MRATSPTADGSASFAEPSTRCVAATKTPAPGQKPSTTSQKTTPKRAIRLSALLQNRKRRAAKSTERRLRGLLATSCLLGIVFVSRAGLARGGPVLVEIGDSAESLLDSRATRRLVALELSDIDVPPPSGNKRARAPLFFRVVLVEHDLRIELWERGEYHGARVVSGSNAAGQLGARRVALAAAELARRLQRKRQIQTERERATELARAEAAAREARRALDGPLALRSSFELATIGDLTATLAGPRLLGQWQFAKRARIESGFAWLVGSAPAAANSEWLELSVAPMQRVSLAEALDLDLGVTVAAAWLRLAKVRSVDAIPNQAETWAARAALVVRVEPRLSRQMRLSLGADAGLLLREVRFSSLAGSEQRLHGTWLGLGIGLVVTPR